MIQIVWYEDTIWKWHGRRSLLQSSRPIYIVWPLITSHVHPIPLYFSGAIYVTFQGTNSCNTLSTEPLARYKMLACISIRKSLSRLSFPGSLGWTNRLFFLNIYWLETRYFHWHFVCQGMSATPVHTMTRSMSSDVTTQLVRHRVPR